MKKASDKNLLIKTSNSFAKIAEEPKRKKKKNNKKGKNSDSSSSEDLTNNKNKNKKQNNIIQDLVAEHFVLLTLIGKGAFGQIILSFNTREDCEVAIKKELKRVHKAPQLKTEAKVYSSLLNINAADISGVKALSQETIQGVPKFYGMGETVDFYYLIMEFLGPNLIELLNYCNTRKFTISTVCLIALQILNRIECIHNHHYIHRDIKPENFLIGIQDKSNIIYAIDFGLSKKYKNSKNHQHIPYREGRPLAGTARYVSINTHLGIEQSRRDDLESIGYVLIFFLRGSLPWQGLKVGNDKYTRIMEKKLQIPTEILCYDLPEEMTFYLNYCKTLRFEDRPDYEYLRGLFIKLIGTCNTLYGLTKEYLKFDWCFTNPTNTIWILYSKNKKSKLMDENGANAQEAFMSSSGIKLRGNSSKDNNNNANNITHNASVREKNNGYANKQLANIEEGGCIEEKDAKTNENIPFDSNYSADNSSEIDRKSNEGSDDTIKKAFHGFSCIDKEKNNLININEEEIKEEIDQYINKLLVGNQILQRIQNDVTEEVSKVKETPVMGPRTNLDITNDNEISKIRGIQLNPKSKFDIKKKEEDEKNNFSFRQAKDSDNDHDHDNNHDEETKQIPQVEGSNNTQKNSKILSPEYKTEPIENFKHIQISSSTDITNKNEKETNTRKKSGIINKDNIDSSDSSLKSGSDHSSKKKDKIEKGNQNNNNNISDKEIKTTTYTQLSNDSSSKKEDNAKTVKQKGKAGESKINKMASEKGEKTFETEIRPRISNPEIEVRRRSKILEMNIVPQMQEMKVSKESMIKISREQLSKHYIVQNELGHGSYGQVKKVHHKKLGEDRAMKIVNKKSESSQNEMEILRKISHPNIVNVFEIYEDSKKYYIMTELLEGGELFEAITSQGSFCELDAMKILKQLLNAVNYLHSRHIVHRDLKPENIMMTSKSTEMNQKFEIKIIDFGTAKILEPNKKLNKFIGTSYYIAPEVLKECYDEKCDIWSCGIILYILLCGYPPFNGSSNIDIYHNITNNHPIFAGEGWKEASKEAIDLIKKMLNKNPAKRYNAEMCLNHKWFKLFDETDKGKEKINNKMQKSVINKMAEFVTQNRFKKAVLQFISTQFNLKKEEENLRELFKQLDTAKKGEITKEVFCAQLCKLYGENDGREISNTIFDNLDLDGSGEISYDEFVSSMIDGKKILTRDRLEKAFKMFDKDGNGRLSIEEIVGVFGGDEKTWKKVIKEIDLNNDGEVDLEEFKSMMLNIDQKIIFGEENNNNDPIIN